MEQTAVAAGDAPGGCDYRLYDQIWRRVSPELDPYPEVRAAAETGSASPAAGAGTAGMAAPAPRAESAPPDADTLPGAEEDPCCMGTQAQNDVEVVAGFVQEELAERQYCLALARRYGRQDAGRLLRRHAREKQEAARELSAAYYLITGACLAGTVTVERLRFEGLCRSLRSVYHQEACNGLNYRRAADATGDVCLQKLLKRLGDASYRRAEEVLSLLGCLVP